MLEGIRRDGREEVKDSRGREVTVEEEGKVLKLVLTETRSSRSILTLACSQATKREYSEGMGRDS